MVESRTQHGADDVGQLLPRGGGLCTDARHCFLAMLMVMLYRRLKGWLCCGDGGGGIAVRHLVSGRVFCDRTERRHLMT